MEDRLERIWEYLDGNLSREERLQVENLQKTDAEFDFLFKSQRQLHQGLSQSVMKPAPLNFADEIMAKVSTSTSLIQSNSFAGFKYIMYGLGTILIICITLAIIMPSGAEPSSIAMTPEVVSFKNYLSNLFSPIQFIKITPYWSVMFAILILFWFDRLFISSLRLKTQRV